MIGQVEMVATTTLAPAVVLAIDPARVSGAAIFAPRRPYLLRSGRVRSATDRAEAVGEALEDAARLEIPLVVALETWTAGGDKFTAKTMLGMGAARGRWLEALELAGYRADHVLQYTPQAWRGGIVKGMRPYPKTSEALKAAVQRWCALTYGHDLDPDTADAVAIGHFTQRRRECFDMVETRRRARGTR